jgi:hypothetical protein
MSYPNCPEQSEYRQGNLAKLRDFLLTNEVPFQMRVFRQYSDPLTKDIIDAGAQSCGTAGCAVGWAPFVIPAEQRDFDGGNYGGIQFWSYVSNHLLALTPDGSFDHSFECVFGGDWEEYDNTRHGAAFRIDEFLNGRMTHTRELLGDFDAIQHYEAMKEAWLAKQENVS